MTRVKRSFQLLFLLLFAINAHAQTRVTKEKILGTWQGFAIDTKGVYYDTDLDSIAVSDSMKLAMRERGIDSTSLETEMRQIFKMLIDMTIEFNADGTAKTISNVPDIRQAGHKETELSKFWVDEERAIVHLVNDKGSDHVMKAVMIGDKLRLLMAGDDEEGESDEGVWLLLKKNKR